MGLRTLVLFFTGLPLALLPPGVCLCHHHEHACALSVAEALLDDCCPTPQQEHPRPYPTHHDHEPGCPALNTVDHSKSAASTPILVTADDSASAVVTVAALPVARLAFLSAPEAGCCGPPLYIVLGTLVI